MGISRDSRHKRRKTGGRMPCHQKKRKYELGRQASMTKLGSKRIHLVRCRGGNLKHRALRLDTGNFSWGSEVTTRKTRIIAVVYNASNNELVRTNTLVKSAIVQIDASPFRQWYEKHYETKIGDKKKGKEEDTKEVKRSDKVTRKIRDRQKHRELDSKLEDQFSTGRLYACISSRPGQSGRADGYILEGKELEFYLKKLTKKRGGKS
mmetsp:Transcript_19363/g.28641  ORF Transcript_19363/g.28641 Transcript_19363/m.28641 type:complete len:207 (-) Transcript_19363:122-742(-)|eukprot:CAMPEP_0171461680 /NCGR_PEP_ID=MMETSP0945-20130129/6031_1 /TAXON_ID=109269 /ORGANISM="Vaucheria litorea, Strain CCMP2940" /LENGTH=206 /DNA_ID=CAMNT_0011988075 /DNA_START=48 /DNA_END=668 /DNA_ORIENTATION=-